MSWGYYNFRPYVPVARRRAQAAVYAAKLAKKEKRTLAPVTLQGRTIAASFWGKAWCENLESYSDYENRLPRGRSYVRNGSVIDLQIQHGIVRALVSGSTVYKVTIDIKTLPAAAWSRIKKDCANTINSLLDLLQGRFDQGIMERLSQRGGGLFPQPKEITMRCSCPDWAGMCKHVAATLYGVGARLDSAPELLFTLRNVDHLELISQAVDADHLEHTLHGHADAALAGSDLGEVFGIDLDTSSASAAPTGQAKASISETTPRPRANKKPALRRTKKTARTRSGGTKVKQAVKKAKPTQRKRQRA
jgi:uncharacterized Zn finger protein